ncbi:hypothetical protein [Mycobacterium sp.]|uniref:hypothetical protein n=1 Tax=Mycobacterium sp. TaxID=1785 RepID=UPI003BAD48E3
MKVIEYHLDMSGFPLALHRILNAWYRWQEVYLRARGSYPGAEQRAPGLSESKEQVFWGKRPPEMGDGSELVFVDSADMTLFLVKEDDCYYIDQEERSLRERCWMFRSFEDVEKYMLYMISQAARPGPYSESPGFRWYRQGLDHRVTLHKSDPENFPGRVSLTVNQEAEDRGWMGEDDAIAFSHAIVLTFEELDRALRAGIPDVWFSPNISLGGLGCI